MDSQVRGPGEAEFCLAQNILLPFKDVKTGPFMFLDSIGSGESQTFQGGR